jgi:transcription elongation GreA/GreB family factor
VRLTPRHSRGQDRSALAVASRDLRYWRARRAPARVIPSPSDITEMRLGSSVSIRQSDGREQTFRIVGEDEANPSQRTISHASPLARALMGKGLGDLARLGTTEIKILAIR